MGRTKGAKSGVIGNNIDKTQFETLCSMMCSQEEICAVFNVSDETLRNWCKENYGETVEKVASRFRNVGKSSLRRTQFKLAEKNTQMAIWLGKQYLNQTDKIENTSEERIVVVNDIPESDE